MHISVDNILKILNQCTLISPLISCSLPASYLDNWAIGPLPHREDDSDISAWKQR